MRDNLASLVADFRKHGAQSAVVLHRGVRRFASTYEELAEAAGRFAAELNRRNIAPGERVVIWGSNSAEWMGVFFGCLLRGVLAVPLDAAGSPQFAARVLNEVSPKLVVGDAALLTGLQTAVPTMLFSELLKLIPQEPDYSVSEAVRSDAPFQIVFTSGTTAEPKGIVHTHGNVLASLSPIENEIGKYRKYERLVHPLRFLHTLPLSHVFGQFMGLWIPGLLAAELHFSDALESSRMLYLLRRERVSVLVAVPRVLGLLRAHLLQRFPELGAELEDARPLPVWKRWWLFHYVHRVFGLKFWAVISGGAALPPQLERFWNRLGFALIQGYGMTETAALVTLNHPFHIGQGTIGKALPGREVKLSETGEILVRGDVVSKATWQDGRLRARESEWLATGDLAERNEAGELRFLGRSGDTIVTASGMNVHPADLESVMVQQPSVRGCVVVACSFESGVEPVSVVLFSGSEEALGEVVRTANSQLADYQALRRVLRWPGLEFPYTSTGKLLRREVASWACQELRERQQHVKGTQPAPDDLILSLVGEITGERAGAGDDGRRLSEDLHLDSLGRVQLASALDQRAGITLDDEELGRVETLGDLRALVSRFGSEGATADAKKTDEQVSSAEVSPVVGGQKVEAAPTRPSIVETSLIPSTEGPVYPRWPWSWPVRALRSLFVMAIVRPLVRLLAAPRVVADRHPVAAVTQLIIANHVTAYDAALIMAALPMEQSRKLAIAMSGEMLGDFREARGQGSALRNLLGPVVYWLITALFNVFPLPRLRAFQRSFQHAGEALDRGYSVLVFPEGTRSRSGELQRFRPGIGLLAQQAQVPVLPVALLGLGEVRGRHAGWFRSGRLEVRVGLPLPYSDTFSPAEWTALLEAAIQSLSA